MPQIIIQTGAPGSKGNADVLREAAHAVDTASDRSRELLIERIDWALRDAEELERRRGRRYEEPAETGFNHRSGSIYDTAVL